MIKTGITLSGFMGPELFRLLINHPDVDLRWVSGSNVPKEGIAAVFDALQGEVGQVSNTPDFDVIDLYIGPDFAGLTDFLARDEKHKAIIVGPTMRPGGYGDEILGVCEFNRKALVRGGRLAMHPDIPTLLGAIALMPLAKNLMLNSRISGMMMLPRPAMRGTGRFRIPATTMSPVVFKTLREKILCQLQTSFKSPIEVHEIENHASDFAAAVLTLDLKIGLGEVRRMFDEFYGDHRHIVFPTHPINEAMVQGTNKTVVGIGNDGEGRLVITVGFDARFKGGAGNLIHIMNLLFGLDEMTGY